MALGKMDSMPGIIMALRRSQLFL